MIPNLDTVALGIYRGGQPDDDGWNELKGLGVTKIVKLNLPSEAQDVAGEALGMTIADCPIDLDEQLLFKPHKTTVQTAVSLLLPQTFVHCEHGQDRTGLVVGCYRVWQCGWTKSDAWDEMKQHGFHEALLGLTLFWEWVV